MVFVDERQIYISQQQHIASGVRSFIFWRVATDGTRTPLNAVDLIALDRAARIIKEIRCVDRNRALSLALCRLLIPCLEYHGPGRHLIAEEWSGGDLCGASLAADTRTQFAKELADLQAQDRKKAVARRKPPASGTLAETLWDAMTNLPAPTAKASPELRRFGEALYFHLVPAGTGDYTTSGPAVLDAVTRCRAAGWKPLHLPERARDLDRMFRQWLGRSVQWSSQLAGEVASRIVREQLTHGNEPSLTQAEQRLLSLMYGAYPELSHINIAFLPGNGTTFDTLLGALIAVEATGGSKAERTPWLRAIHKGLKLLGSFRHRRKMARAQERREDRQNYPHAPGRDPQYERDEAAPTPDRDVAAAELLRLWAKKVLRHLGKADAARLRALIKAKNDRTKAAESLGITLTQFSRQWRQTTRPNIVRAMGELKLDEKLLE